MAMAGMNKHDFDVLVVGELNADLILSGDVTPQYGQAEKLIDDASLVLGSSSAIFAAGAAPPAAHQPGQYTVGSGG